MLIVNEKFHLTLFQLSSNQYINVLQISAVLVQFFWYSNSGPNQEQEKRYIIPLLSDEKTTKTVTILYLILAVWISTVFKEDLYTGYFTTDTSMV